MPFTLISGVIPRLFIWKVNTWGYSTINFFAPMSRYASAGGGPVAASKELKKMVKALHNAGIEVLTSCMHGKSVSWAFFNIHPGPKDINFTIIFPIGYSGCCLQPYKRS